MAVSAHLRRAVIFLLASTLSPAKAPGEDGRILVFSKTAGFRHASIPHGIAEISRLGRRHRFGVDATEDHLLGGIRFAAGFPEDDGARPRTVAPRP